MGAPGIGQMSREIFNMLITPDSDLLLSELGTKMQFKIIFSVMGWALLLLLLSNVRVFGKKLKNLGRKIFSYSSQ